MRLRLLSPLSSNIMSNDDDNVKYQCSFRGYFFYLAGVILDFVFQEQNLSPSLALIGR